MQESEKQIKMRDWNSVDRLMSYTSNQLRHSYLACVADATLRSKKETNVKFNHLFT